MPARHRRTASVTGASPASCRTAAATAIRPAPHGGEEVSAPFGTAEYDKALAARLDGESDDVRGRAATISPACRRSIAAHIGVMGSSFGGTVTLLAASKSDRFRCAVDFAGAAMNWEKTPGLRALMIGAAQRLTRPTLLPPGCQRLQRPPDARYCRGARGHRQGLREPRLSRLRPHPRRRPFPLPRRHRRLGAARARLPAIAGFEGGGDARRLSRRPDLAGGQGLVRRRPRRRRADRRGGRRSTATICR